MPRDNVKSCSEDHSQSSNSDLKMKERSAIEVDIQEPKQNGHSNGTPETALDPSVNGTSENSDVCDEKTHRQTENSASHMELESEEGRTKSGSGNDVRRATNKELMPCAEMRHDGFFESLVGLGNVAGPATDILSMLKVLSEMYNVNTGGNSV